MQDTRFAHTLCSLSLMSIYNFTHRCFPSLCCKFEKHPVAVLLRYCNVHADSGAMAMYHYGNCQQGSKCMRVRLSMCKRKYRVQGTTISTKSHVMAGVEMSPSTHSEDASNTIEQNDAEAFASELTGIVTWRQRHRV